MSENEIGEKDAYNLINNGIKMISNINAIILVSISVKILNRGTKCYIKLFV